MILNLCTTSDDINVLNKSVNIVQSLDVVLRKDFNIIDPVFYLQFENASDNLEFNYFELPELGKKYNVVSSEMINDKLVKFECSIDVLETYKTNILSGEYNFNRSMRPGDYNGQLSETTLKTISKHESNHTFNSGISQILVTVGGYNE